MSSAEKQCGVLAELELIAALLGVEGAKIEKALCNREIQTGSGGRTELFVKPCTSAQAYFSRDTLAKALYSKMFDFLVKKINDSIKLAANFEGIQIGVLDIYGFEIFQVRSTIGVDSVAHACVRVQYNSFEQLCINFVNERLQQIFIELTMKAEQEEYRQEGIPWKDVEYYNNKPICDLIEGVRRRCARAAAHGMGTETGPSVAVRRLLQHGQDRPDVCERPAQLLLFQPGHPLRQQRLLDSALRRRCTCAARPPVRSCLS
jgi:myosin heavy subunit